MESQEDLDDEQSFIQKRLKESRETEGYKKKVFVTAEPTKPNPPTRVSALSEMLLNSQGNENDFLLPPPSEKDPDFLKLKVYFFSTPKCLDLRILKTNIVIDVISHIMTLYRRDPELSEWLPLKYPNHPNAYELRLIDDDESYYMPFNEIPPI